MKLREIRVKHFRNLVDVTIPMGDTTVLIGENNSGKTALLDALRIALPRSVAARGTGSRRVRSQFFTSKRKDKLVYL